MARGVGEIGPVQELIPAWLAVIAALLTQLGDLWFLASLWGALYWLARENQDDLAAVGGLTLAGLGLYRALKAVFALPRPGQPPLDPESLPVVLRVVWDLTATATGFGFPSGHATNATVVYVGLACVLAFGTRRRRFALAGLLVATVSLTRVALGVHFLVDVVAGILLGIAVLAVGLKGFANRRVGRPTLAFAFAVLTGLFYTAVAREELYAIAVLGSSLGAFAGWQGVLFVRSLLGTDGGADRSAPLVHGGLVVLAVAPLSLLLLVSPFLGGFPFAAGGVAGLAVAVAVFFPVVRHTERLDRVPTVARLWLRAR